MQRNGLQKANSQKANNDLSVGPMKSELSFRLKEYGNLSLNSRIENKEPQRC